ncbi:hypothetical protein D1872_274750 [compost metagenome]
MVACRLLNNSAHPGDHILGNGRHRLLIAEKFLQHRLTAAIFRPLERLDGFVVASDLIPIRDASRVNILNLFAGQSCDRIILVHKEYKGFATHGS